MSDFMSFMDATFGDATDDRLVAQAPPAHAEHGQITDPIKARQFIRAGRATFTLVSKATGTRFTYKVEAAKDGHVHFVKVLRGSNNESDYAYIGTIRRDLYRHGEKSKIAADAKSVVAFKWAWQMLAQGNIPPSLEIWHEGTCGRCGLKLTVPASVASGYGPECIKMVGG